MADPVPLGVVLEEDGEAIVDEGWVATSFVDEGDPMGIVEAYVGQAEAVGLVTLRAERAAELEVPRARHLLPSLRHPPCGGLLRMAEPLEIARDIAASPEAVYAAIAEVERMGEWSEECVACEWTDGSEGPVVGARLDGHNRHGDREWTSQCRVIEAEPGRAFAFECSMFDVHYSTWGYRIEPTDGGCRVTEWNLDLRPESARELSTQISGVADRTERNRRTMSATLDRLAAALEG